MAGRRGHPRRGPSPFERLIDATAPTRTGGSARTIRTDGTALARGRRRRCRHRPRIGGHPDGSHRRLRVAVGEHGRGRPRHRRGPRRRDRGLRDRCRSARAPGQGRPDRRRFPGLRLLPPERERPRADPAKRDGRAPPGSVPPVPAILARRPSGGRGPRCGLRDAHLVVPERRHRHDREEAREGRLCPPRERREVRRQGQGRTAPRRRAGTCARLGRTAAGHDRRPGPGGRDPDHASERWSDGRTAGR